MNMAGPHSHVRKCNACETELTTGPGDEFLRCPACGFITRKHIPSADDVDELFSESYFKGSEYADYLRERNSLEENFRNRVDALLKYIDAPKTKRLFEIGCAYGFFLNLAKLHFASTRGIDVSRPAIQYAQQELQLDVECGDYLESEQAVTYDVVCMWDTIAHITAPEKYLAKIAKEIKPGGVLAISTGDIGSLNARIRGTEWRIMRQPTMLHHFSAESICLMLINKGFRVISISHPGYRRSVRAVCRGVFGENYAGSILGRALTRLGLMDLSFVLNLYDLMLVVAERSDQACHSTRHTVRLS
jgi:2-polyprenyl-3-methyl-5-hydroxy-6-metoxy-1,4-benzoquinol methylase